MFSLSDKFYNDINDILCDIEFIQKGKNTLVSNISAVFDIESSSFYINNEKRACMYAWVFGINGKCIRGRTWKEFLQVIDRLKVEYGLSIIRRIVVYVHNLSYEFQWFRHLFKWYKVFNAEERKPIYAITTDGIEFRCSYLLSGYSLTKVGENLNKYKVNKKVGDLDYDLIRHKSTPLTETEWGYILNDGLVVMAYIQEEIERTGSITNIPLTKTGYVRNFCREKCLNGNNSKLYSKAIRTLTMDKKLFLQCLRAFMGGWVHGNHNKIEMMKKHVSSLDLTSSYPTVLISEKFPMSDPQTIIIKDKSDLDEKIKKYCCLFDIKFHKIMAKFDNEHYISLSKCINPTNYIVDNGRIVYADEITMSITDVDFKIISEMYEWGSIEVGNFNIFRRGYLPKSIIECVLEFYRGKTELKGVPDKEVEYLVLKGMLNSIYGMMVTNPCKEIIEYDDEREWFIDDSNIEEMLDKYNKSSSRFLYYPWGIWVTAYARFNLWTAIRECNDDYIYCDTDSVKINNYEKHKDYFDTYNKNIITKVKNCLKYYNINPSLAEPKNIKGEKQPIGVWTYEGTYDTFKTLGAKRYIYTLNNELHITISGVSKKSGKEYLLYKYKNFDNIFKNFKDGLVFPSTYKDKNKIKKGSGKLTHTYLDEYHCDYITDYLGNTDSFCEYSSVHLEASSYNMSLDSDFINYLLGGKSSNIV